MRTFKRGDWVRIDPTGTSAMAGRVGQILRVLRGASPFSCDHVVRVYVERGEPERWNFRRYELRRLKIVKP